MNLLDKFPAKRFIFTKRGLTFVISVALGSVLTVLILFYFLPFGKDIYNQLFPKPPSKAATSFPNEPLNGYTITDGRVYEIELPNDNIAYIGGRFQHAGLDTGLAVPVATSSGLPNPPYDYPKVYSLENYAPAGYVNVIIPDGYGGWFMGGRFTVAGTRYNNTGGFARRNLVHILANGAVDPSFDANVTNVFGNEEIRALFLHPDRSTLYVGGLFTSIGGQPRSNIAALDPNTGQATSFNPGADWEVETFDMSENCDILYVGGYFTKIGGQTRRGLASINLADNTVTSFNPMTASWGVEKIILSGSTLYVAGALQNIGGQLRNGIGAVDVTTGLPTSFNPNASYVEFPGSSGYIDTMALSKDGTTLYVGGSFDLIGGQSRNAVAALETSTGQASDFNPNLTPDSSSAFVETLALSADESVLFMGGVFSTVGGQVRKNGAAANTQSSAVTSFDPSPNWDIKALALSPEDNQTIYVGGEFLYLDWRERANAAAFDTRTGHLTPFNPIVGGPIYTGLLSPDRSTWYVGGDFIEVDGQERVGLAAFDVSTDTLRPFQFNLGSTSAVHAAHKIILSPDYKTLYVGGAFVKIGSIAGSGGDTRVGVAAIDLTTNTVSPFNAHIGIIPRQPPWPSPCQRIFGEMVLNLAISPDGRILYVGGEFETIGGVVEGLLIACGSYIAANHLAAVDIATSTPISTFNIWPTLPGGSETCNYFDHNCSVKALLMSPDNKTLYVGGDFQGLGGQLRNLAAAVDIATTTVNSFNPDVLPFTPYDFTRLFRSVTWFSYSPDGTLLYTGGVYDSVGGQPRPGSLAIIDPISGALDAWDPQLVPPGERGGTTKVVFSSDNSRLYAVGDWTNGKDIAIFAPYTAPSPSPVPFPSPGPGLCVISPTPTPTPTPSPSPTPTSSPTPTPTPGPTPTPPAGAPAPTPTPGPAGGPTPTPFVPVIPQAAPVTGRGEE